MGKIIDCFPFFNEVELLELRVKMLAPYVDLFVISEANRTHSGLPKEYNVKHLIKELDLPADKIRVLEVDLYADEAQTPSYIDVCHATSAKSADDAISWTRERLQRDAVSKIIDEFADDDVFIMSDCDEIIDPTAIEFLVKCAREHPNILVRVPLRLLESRADLQVVEIDGTPVRWDESMFLCMKHHIKATEITLLKANKTPNEFSPWPGEFIYQDGKRIENLGWHFTWMGDKARKLYKSQSFIHHSNLNVVNNVSADTIGFLSEELSKNIETEKKYKLQKINHNLLPEKIFDIERIKNFLLPIEETNMNTVTNIVNFLLYNGDRNLLEFRIKLLYDYVDEFIIAEGNHTISGMSKPFSCEKIINELAIPKEKVKIVQVEIPGLDVEKDSAIREQLLWDSLKEYIQPEKFYYVTYEDEIPDPLFFNYYVGTLKNNQSTVLRVPMIRLSGRADLCLESNGKESQWVDSYVCSGEILKKQPASAIRNPQYPGVYNVYLRDNNQIENAGWKMEWMGNKEQRKEKYRAAAEYLKHSNLGKRLRLEYIDGYDPVEGGADALGSQEFKLKKYNIERLPAMLKNTPKFLEYFLPQINVLFKEQPPIKYGDECLPYLKFNRQPMNSVFIIDNFYEDPYAVREFAMNQEYEEDGEGRGYIGRRTKKQFFPPGLKERFEEIIGEPIVKWEEHGFNGRFQYNVAGQKLVYHCDEQKWAGLIYLTPDAPYQAGTRLLAHKKTRVRFNKEPRIMECFNQHTFLDGTPFETVDHVGNVFNRLVIYRGGLIHAASEYFGWNIENSRLWHMFFFD
jgi:hypothetical protein